MGVLSVPTVNNLVRIRSHKRISYVRRIQLDLAIHSSLLSLLLKRKNKIFLLLL
jgi:hypothetical protein